MPADLAEFYIRKTSLERLFRAKQICFLIGGYDGSGNYGDIVILAANLQRMKSPNNRALLVPLLEWQCRESHDDLIRQFPSLFGDACFLYYNILSDRVSDGGSAVAAGDLVALAHPPATYAQIMVYGGGFFNDWWGKRKLDVIDALETWLHFDSDDAASSIPVMMVGQQVSPNFISGPESERFARLLEKASAVGVRDKISLQAITQRSQSSVSSHLFVSGDDAASYIIACGHQAGPSAGNDLPTTDKAPTEPFVVNVHLSLEYYVTGNPDRLLDTAVFIINEVGRLCAGNVAVNLIVAYEDRRISETRHVHGLRESLVASGISVNLMPLITELSSGFSCFRNADLAICCSYHVALTSLVFSVPTILLHANDYYAHKHEGLKRQFGIPEQLLFDVENGSHDRLAETLREVVLVGGFRQAASSRAAEGAADMTAKSSRTTALLGEWLTSGYVSNLEDKYKGVVDKLSQTLGQLSDIQFEHERLFNAYEKVRNRESEGQPNRPEDLPRAEDPLPEIQQPLEQPADQPLDSQIVLRFQLADRLYHLLAVNRVLLRISELVAHGIWRVIR